MSIIKSCNILISIQQKFYIYCYNLKTRKRQYETGSAIPVCNSNRYCGVSNIRGGRWNRNCTETRFGQRNKESIDQNACFQQPNNYTTPQASTSYNSESFVPNPYNIFGNQHLYFNYSNQGYAQAQYYPQTNNNQNLSFTYHPNMGFAQAQNFSQPNFFWNNFFPDYNPAQIPERRGRQTGNNILLFSSRNTGKDKGSQNGTDSIAKQQRDKLLVEKLRQWNQVQPNGVTNSSKQGVEFTLLSYNVLAQDLLTEHSYLYRNHSPRACLWETRWNNLYKEITSYDADIICLQEVQESHLAKYYSKFEQLGYESIYKKRTGYRTDGCALYYRKNKFLLHENITVEFNQDNVFLNRDNVAIIAKLAPVLNPNASFVVATTHLLYNPKRNDIRVAQSQILMAEIERMAYIKKRNKYVPIIITGDFNSEPGSPVYEYIVNGNLHYENLTRRRMEIPQNKTFLTGKTLLPRNLKITDNSQHFDLMESRLKGKQLTRTEEDKLIHLRHTERPHSAQLESFENINETLFSTGVLRHPFCLKSAFLHRNESVNEATTNQDGWITVDYIFYSGKCNNQSNRFTDGNLKLVSRYSIPTVKQLKKIKNIPNFALGSDHLALLVKFNLAV